MHQGGHDSGGRFRATCGHVPAGLRRGGNGCGLSVLARKLGEAGRNLMFQIMRR